MKTLLLLLLSLICIPVPAQTHVEKRVAVTGQSRLILDLPFADEIHLEAWDKNEVLTEAEVLINNGEEDQIFVLDAHASANTIYVEMDKNRWKDFSWDGMCHCKQTKISYHVYLPGSLQTEASTISGSYVLDYYGRSIELKTISGDIDLNVPGNRGVDFRVRTVSGEVYSDLEIAYPDGKDGLKQLAGINVRGLIAGGGPTVDMNTVSGDIYLRKK